MSGPTLPVLGQPANLAAAVSDSTASCDLSVEELEQEIRTLKKDRNAVILAHYYQESELQDIADFVGDSLQLSQAAANTSL